MYSQNKTFYEWTFTPPFADIFRETQCKPQCCINTSCDMKCGVDHLSQTFIDDILQVTSKKRCRNHLTKMPPSNNRIKVENLINTAPARGKSSHRTSPLPTNDIFDIACGIDNCNRRFASPDALQAHQRRTHPCPTSYVCKHCKSSFSTSANLTKHVRYSYNLFSNRFRFSIL